ncbi:MAG: carbonic anhydrase [Actinobacteria bacterium]|jgi:carbonic anhydrase|nr:carbonic anhydrase [Actinomycetota bacterium]
MSDFPADTFADVLAGNASYVESFSASDLGGRALQGLAIVTCMDSRIEPLALVGMKKGDAKILRNAGARVTDDVLRTLVLAAYLLGVERVLVMPHTDCKMASATEEQIHDRIRADYGVETSSVEFRTVEDQTAALAYDVRRIRAYPLLPRDLVVAGAVYDVRSGALVPQDV